MEALELVHNEVPENHMIYLVQRVSEGRHISRHKQITDAAKQVTDRSDYCVIVPSEECHDPDSLLAFIQDAGEEHIIPIGKIAEQANE